MTRLVFHHDEQNLPSASDTLLPVQLYGRSGKARGDISVIGNSVIEAIRRLGVPIPGQIMDFLTIALAVTAADTFVHRTDSTDGWARQLSLQLPLYEPDRWKPIQENLERALHFLSGDIWSFDFHDGGYAPPTPFGRRYKRINLRDLDCVCLFSGGLDSAIGAIELITKKRKPLLVSHGYTFDKGKQDSVASRLNGEFERLLFNADPHIANGQHDVTMRTRSVNFLAFAAVGASAVQAVSQQKRVDLFVPENGFISLNAPLTPRRVGTLSTRTTHPHFIDSVQGLFDAVEIPCRITNPYQFKTKGQMASECQNQKLLSDVLDSTVSCSHWKRSNQQCGICVPCIIRRAALHAAGFDEKTKYTFEDVADVLNETDRRDDLLALSIAIAQKTSRNVGLWIADSGPLPPATFTDFQQVFRQGLKEVEVLLKAEGVL